MNRTKTVMCPVCGGDAKDRRHYDAFDNNGVVHKSWSRTEVACQDCGYHYESAIFEPYTSELIGHVMLERELFAADDRNCEQMEARLVRQHVERLDVLQEGRTLIASKEYRNFRNTLSFANANHEYSRKKHLDFLKANKDKFPRNLVEFKLYVKSWSKNKGKS